MAALTAFGRQINLFKEHLSGPARKEIMIKTAEQAFGAAMKQNTSVLGHVPTWKRIVDGVHNAPLRNVKPGGVVIYLFDVAGPGLRQAVNETLRNLRRLSPVDMSDHRNTIVYKESHVVLVNNVAREYGDDFDIGPLGPNDSIQITNLLPYARRLEVVNPVLGRAWSKQAPNGIYNIAYESLKARHGRILNTRYTFATFPGREIGKTRKGETPRTKSDVDRAARYPTIVIWPK